MTTEPYALSTIAMTVYNLATQLGHPLEGAWELAEQIRELYHPGASDEIIGQAFEELRSRRLLVECAEGYRPIDTKHRPVCWRDITDVEVDPESGELLGGWGGWMVRDPARGAVEIEEVL